MLHPVGRLPARVYWRRRLVLLAVLVALLAGGGWLAVRLLDPPGEGSTATGATTSSAPVPTPGPERVLSSLTSVRTPGTAPGMPVPEVGRTPGATGPRASGPCTDDMVELTVPAPTRVPVGSKPTVEIVALEIVWSGLTSEPGCAAERTTPAAGVYLLRGLRDPAAAANRRIRLV